MAKTETKDPVADGIAIGPAHRIVVLEGIYLHMAEPPWDRADFDETWLVEAPEEVARPRIIERHVRTGVAPDAEAARIRADTSDLPNGRYMLERARKPTRVIRSIDDAAFAP
jgi:pantothenate kinase